MNSKTKYILAIDQSTSATKAMIFNRNAELIHRVSIPHQQFYPQAGFVEHDVVEIFNNVITGMNRVVSDAKIDTKEIESIAITNQRETSVIWDKNTGIPVANAAVWQCQRGVEFCNELKAKKLEAFVQDKTGLIIDPYFSASKLSWMMNNIDGLKEKAIKGDLLLGTIDSWLLFKLTGGKVHATDYSNACRTMLFNINTLEWDKELAELCNLEMSMFPEVKFSDEVFAHTDPELIFDEPLPIAGLLGDSHAALFGQNCFIPGFGKATYGTGSSVMMNIGKEPLAAPKGLVTSIGFGRAKSIDYVFEGNIHATGDTLNWLKNELQLINDASETETLAESVEGNDGVYLVPAFVGLGAPYWDNEARACIVGMSRNSTKAHVVRAALESIAYQIKDLTDLMGLGAAVQLKELRVDGGPTRNNFLMQFQADMLQGKVERSNIEEISALGATFMAGLATGFWKDLDEIKSLRLTDRTFHPEMKESKSGELYKGWKNAVRKSRL
ncbi:glycerol kinase GlpK [Maribellus sediminis]|uniref:glycerol kinase GlpK n=1 Tax=Maribellus sediminis TaxID=2696285 RepID=UPI00143165E5|nr:glycerol kinase GlpK [Maribellus sediminis]